MPGCQFVDFLMGRRIVGEAQRVLIEVEVEGHGLAGIGRKAPATGGEHGDHHSDQQRDDATEGRTNVSLAQVRSHSVAPTGSGHR